MIETVVSWWHTTRAGDRIAWWVRRVEALSLSHVVRGLLPVRRLVMMSVRFTVVISCEQRKLACTFDDSTLDPFCAKQNMCDDATWGSWAVHDMMHGAVVSKGNYIKECV